MEAEAFFFKSKAVSCKVGKNKETIILRVFGFFCLTAGISETQELSPKTCFIHKPIYACLSLFMGSWNMQEHWDSDLFCFGVGRICGSFPPLFQFVQNHCDPDFPLCLLHLRTTIFEAHLLSRGPVTNLATLGS